MSLSRPRKLKNPIVIRKVVGHSMLPVLPPGTVVIGLTWSLRPTQGKVVIVEHDNKEKIKRIQDVKDDEIYIVGDHDTSSTDSRHFGWISSESIKARVIWPRTKKIA